MRINNNKAQGNLCAADEGCSRGHCHNQDSWWTSQLQHMHTVYNDPT